MLVVNTPSEFFFYIFDAPWFKTERKYLYYDYLSEFVDHEPFKFSLSDINFVNMNF